MEIELKYLITENSDKEGLKKYFDDNKARSIEMHAEYYVDAPNIIDGPLKNTTFRIREENGEKVVTMKWGGKSENGLHERQEVNIPLSEYAKGNIPEIAKDRAPKLENIVKALEMSFLRREFDYKNDDFEAVISVDKGKMTKNGKELPILEVEIENISGNIEKMTEFGVNFAEKYGLEPGNASKFSRGMAL